MRLKRSLGVRGRLGRKTQRAPRSPRRHRPIPANLRAAPTTSGPVSLATWARSQRPRRAAKWRSTRLPAKHHNLALRVGFLVSRDGFSDVPGCPLVDCRQSSTAVKTEARKETERPREGAKVSITKVFDFAGEEVRVTKEVDAESKEARSYLKSLEAEKEEGKEDEKGGSGSGTASTAPSLAAKRPGGAAGLSAVLGQIGGKKTKMSTLEKSKMDWDQFKEGEGISDELATHNRGKAGYIERQAFLDRVDHRTFEIEKSIRLTKSKR
ncbi:craniofacial development protein 1 isoform X2 [Lampetra fluviatilis]